MHAMLHETRPHENVLPAALIVPCSGTVEGNLANPIQAEPSQAKPNQTKPSHASLEVSA